jgi:hypothetical protein
MAATPVRGVQAVTAAPAAMPSAAPIHRRRRGRTRRHLRVGLGHGRVRGRQQLPGRLRRQRRPRRSRRQRWEWWGRRPRRDFPRVCRPTGVQRNTRRSRHPRGLGRAGR